MEVVMSLQWGELGGQTQSGSHIVHAASPSRALSEPPTSRPPCVLGMGTRDELHPVPVLGKPPSGGGARVIWWWIARSHTSASTRATHKLALTQYSHLLPEPLLPPTRTHET